LKIRPYVRTRLTSAVGSLSPWLPSRWEDRKITTLQRL
jgi:hypothetical protein